METADPRNSIPPEVTARFSAFVAVVLGAAVLVSAGPLLALPGRFDELPAAFWTMAALAVACDARPFVPPGRRESSAVFPSTCFTFAILLGWGLGPAVAVQAVAVVVSGWRLGYAPWRTAFNAGQYACALGAAYALTLLGPGSVFDGGRLRWTDVAAVGAATLAWFVVNYGLVSAAVRLRFGDRWWPGLRQGLGFELLATGSLLLLAPVLVAAARASAALIPLVLVPLFAVYRMARLSVEQQQLASLDPLTGLPNRKALLADVGEQVHLHAERAARGERDTRLALLLLDLDRFKHVNDALGHAVGDRLLVEVSARLTETVGGAMVARLGGDEFAIVVTGLADVSEARDLADQVVTVLAEPVALDGLPLDVGGSIGIAIYPDHGEDFATLMRHADVAMYDAKHRNDTVAVYTAESDHNSAERLGLLADLRRVLDSGPADAERAVATGPPDAERAVATGPPDAERAVATGPPDAEAPPGARPPVAARAGEQPEPAVDLSGIAPGRVLPAGGPAGVRGSDGAELPAAGVRTRTDGSGRWRLRRRRQPSEPVAYTDELINHIATAADPIRRRAARAAESGPDERAAGGTTRSASARAHHAPAGPDTAGAGVDTAGAGLDTAGMGVDTAGTGLDDAGTGPDTVGAGTGNGSGPGAGNGGAATGVVDGSTGDGRSPGQRREASPVHPNGVATHDGPNGGRSASGDGGRRRATDADPAADAGEITMYYQPQIAIATGEVVGVEALLRWRHPRRGMVDPEELIRVAEQSAVMRLLTRRVVDDVVAQLAAWASAGIALRAALNVSVRDLHTGEIADQIADRLDRHGVPPHQLQLEITEGALMADPRRVLATISRLHRIGVGIALDDFGTGYSSLQHLRRLPLSEVKVDRSFVLGMVEDADDAAIVTSTIGLAGALGLRVVAEGVEDERTWRMLYAAGCDAAQGWFYARPMPADELVGWLARYRPVRPTADPDAEIPRRHAR
ncbi:EAL domain-containing protein [Micromonospora endolithica]|uniref:EAL domain-containing protein n=1 Tax=Micromonospora endolithica TaxID=230091 RepID=A0A3A9ZPE9_9ACTN|nr:EAL domain-containing protein [Micromonospora endolithica]RKN49426.1 EAL domain-containing protein [Micromonospora endolithica]TWJ23622.1 diguanylate cyclase (GGDEF)-like protein [Micromonospora endolithica]